MEKQVSEVEKRAEMGLDAQRRAQNCLIDIKKILDRWECQIEGVVQIAGDRISTSYMVVPLIKIPTESGKN